MGSHPLNLLIRLLLEISALLFIGMWGWEHGGGWQQYALAIGLPLTLAAIWGIFAVPNDPSRSGKAPIPTPGVMRLLIELGIFAFAAWSLYDIGSNNAGLALGITVTLHYLASYDRVMWLTKN